MAPARADAHSYPFSVRIGKRKSAPHGKINSKTAGNANKIWKRKIHGSNAGTSRIPTQTGNKLAGVYIMARKTREAMQSLAGSGRLWQALRDTARERRDIGGNRACENGRVNRKRQGNLQALGDSA